ncbi:hypothetical protein [Sphingomonas crusticola]|uniref:hypothetical protein n=1 Tax=Sphingomonas crusticola TaxID=1697973 RepID=UPI0013C31FFD|nr:hypothetical protein [Sphingomonas crusticola]
MDEGSAAALLKQGIECTRTGHLAAGEAILRSAVAAHPDLPDLRRVLGLNLLTQGRYAEAWPFYEARIAVPWLTDGLPRDFPFPRWQGEDLAGRHVTIFPEQGWGDQIQFIRFLPALAAFGARITLLAPPLLVRLFRHNFPDVQIFPADGAVDFADPDYWLTLVDLPGRLGVTLNTIPAAPYLTPPGRWANVPEGPKVGLVTKGNPNNERDRWRSLPDAVADRLRDGLPGRVFGLLPDATGARDFAETAAVVDGLDLVVAVDTAAAHLAGAMGKRCFLLLSGVDTDWRWMRDRIDSPWYPNHVLYRGGADGAWDAAVDRLIGDARALLG